MVNAYEKLEEEFTTWNNLSLENNRMVVCSSGTAALHLALECLPIISGTRLALPDYAMISCARAVTLADLKATFIGVDSNGLLDISMLEEALHRHPHISTVMVVHTYGRKVNMDRLHKAVKPYNIRVVEDLAEAHGLQPHPDTDAACWSFYQNKVIGGEEGGAIWFKDYNCATKARSLRSVGFTETHDYRHNPRGHNYRLANCLAEKVSSSIKEYYTNIMARRISEGFYDYCCPEEWQMPRRDVPWVYDFRISGMTKNEQDCIVKELRAAGIPARHGFHPLHLQREYDQDPFSTYIGTDRSERLSTSIIYLPLTPGLVTKFYAECAFNIVKKLAS